MTNGLRRRDPRLDSRLVRSALFALERIEARVLMTAVSGTLFGDYDGDGTRDAGEPGLAGWTVFVDADNDNVPDPTEPQLVTTESGAYSFDLPAGNHRIRAVMQPGFALTTPAGDNGTGGWADGVDDGTNGFVDDVVGRDFWSNDNNSNPATAGDDHGTHVAGIAAARTNNSTGVAGTAGGATIMPLRFYATSGGTWTSTHVLNSYKYAADNGAKVLTTSYNVDGFVSQQAFIDALNYMYTRGVLHFNSAGNNGQTNPVRQRFDTSLYVVNTQSNDVRNTGSNIGWGVDISAPGTSIFATALGTTVTTYNYESKTGTSMASPNAAAVAALIWSAHPEWTRDQVAAALIGSADNIDAVQTTTARGLVGSGRVNANRGVNQMIAPPRFKNTSNTPLLPGLPAEGATAATQPTAFTLDVANVFDPATMVASNFEIRGDGADNTFGTADDTLVPFSLAFGDPLAPSHGYQVGTNRLRFTIPVGTMPADQYRFSALPTLLDPFGQALDGNNDGVGGDALTRTFIVGAARGAPAIQPVIGVEPQPADWTGATFTDTEVLVRVNSLNGLEELARYVRNNPNSDVARMVNPAGSTQMFQLEGDSLVELKLRAGADPLAAIAALQKLALVQYAEPNLSFQGDPREFTPNDPSYGTQFHHTLMQNNTAWDTTLGDARIIIGVTDDGFALSHPDLYQNIWVNQAEIPATRRANLTDLNNDGYISMMELNDPINIGSFKANDTNADGKIDAVDLLAPRGGSDGALLVTVVDGTPIENTLLGVEDIVRPTFVGGDFAFETSQRVTFSFSEDVQASVANTDVLLENLTTGTTVNAADLLAEYDTRSNTARFGLSTGVLPDGNYRATLAAGNVGDPYGNTLLSNAVVNFFVLGGDANRDRTVDIGDFSALASNFNAAGTFSDGDFNYSGTVEIGDFSILASKFNTSLPAARGVADQQAMNAAAKTGNAFSVAPIRSLLDGSELDDMIV